MKSIKFTLILSAIMMFAGSAAYAQSGDLGPQWGENATQEQRHDNALKFNFYRDAYNSQRYDDALKYLPALLENSPKGAQNIYVYAINIYKNKIQRATDLKQRKLYVDSLLVLYDLRVENFGENAKYGRSYILSQKAKDYVSFMSTDRDGVGKYFVDAIKANENEPDADIIMIYFNELTTDYKSELVDTEYYMAQYDWLSGLLAKVTDPEAENAKTTFDTLFVSSGAANCTNIESIFKSRIAATPNDTALLTKAFGMLLKSKCDTPFLTEVGAALYKAEPTASTARLLATAYTQNGDNKKALAYLKEAFDRETDPTSKGMIALEISGTELSLKNPSAAASYANQARQIMPNNGYAYMLLAQSYAEGANTTCSGFDRQTVYWLAYDLLSQARSLFTAGSTELAQVDNLMGMFRSSFPSQDELFFRGLNSGAGYNVQCGWITGRTTVK